MKRPMAVAVGLCLAGSALALYAVTRTWDETVTHRVEPLPPYTETTTGSELYPGLAAVAIVGLAGAGAVLATKGIGRRLVGVLLAVVGLLVAAAGAVGLGSAETVWPVVTLLGGLAVIAGGLWVVAAGQRWPHMGARYERTASSGRTGSTDTWDALDRGEDPTANDAT